MQLGDHLGFAGLVLTLIGGALTILLPTQRWVGYLFIIAAVLVLLTWGYKTLTVEPAAVAIEPVLSWTPAPIVEGQGLGPDQLNAVASSGGHRIDGEYSYNPAMGATLSAGTDTLSVEFTPNEKEYSRKTATATVKVLPKAKPALASPTPKIQPYIIQTHMHEETGASRALRVISLVSFKNSGSPGTVFRILLTLKLKEKIVQAVYPQAPKRDERLFADMGDGEHVMTVEGRGFWGYTVGANPIAEDTSGEGIVIGLFPNVRIADVVADKAVLTVRCEDTRGRISRGTHVLGNSTAVPPTLGNLQPSSSPPPTSDR